MKSNRIAVLTLILGAAMATSAFAQGRHDERPHGVTKPAAESKDKARTYAASGRHDEKPHGLKPAATTKDAPKAPEATPADGK